MKVKKLNHNIKVGDKFEILISGWQCEDVPRGQYEIIDISKKEYTYFGTIKQICGDNIYTIDGENLEFFCGEDIEPEYDIKYNYHEYMPTEDEVDENDFITESPCEFGFWYLGHMGDSLFISSTMISENFAWVKMPW